jgi:hypothetical protein
MAAGRGGDGARTEATTGAADGEPTGATDDEPTGATDSEPTRATDSEPTRATDGRPPRLASRTVVTWIELTVVVLAGGLLAEPLTGPPGFVVYLSTSLAVVAVLLYNVDALVDRKLAT